MSTIKKVMRFFLICIYMNSVVSMQIQGADIAESFLSMSTEESLETAARILSALSQDEQLFVACEDLYIQSIRLIAMTLKSGLSLQERKDIAEKVQNLIVLYTNCLEKSLANSFYEIEEQEQEFIENRQQLYALLQSPLVASLCFYVLLGCEEMIKSGDAHKFVEKINDSLLKMAECFFDTIL